MGVRRGTADDLPAINEIYNHYVRSTVITFETEPYSARRRQDWFEHYATTGRHQLFVAEQDGRVAGYVTSSPFHARPAYGTTVETSIYLHHERTGHGLGRALYEALFAALADTDVHRAMALIALPNEASVTLHERFGFTLAGVLDEVGFKLGRFVDVGYWSKPL
jgi:phosphinothricin acetyltransferase